MIFMQTVEIDAANALLDTRVRIHVPAPRFFRLFGLKSVPFVLYRPVCAQLLRISRLYVSMGIDLEKLEEAETIEMISSVSENIVKASRLIALGMIRSTWASRLFHRAFAAYLRRNMDAKTMSELAKMIVMYSGAENFIPIIKSIAHLKVTEPNLSRIKTES